MTLVRCVDPEAVALMAEIAERGDVMGDYNPFGNFLLELWEEDAKTFSPQTVIPEAKDRIETVFQTFKRFHPEGSAVCGEIGLPYHVQLDAVAARAKLLELLIFGLQYFPAYEDENSAHAFLDRL